MASPLCILLIEANTADAARIQARVAAGGIQATWLRASDPDGLVNVLETAHPDLILSDYSHPALSGLEALHIARARCPDVPFLFVAQAFGEQLVIETFKKGATDYVLKPGLERLVPAILRALREQREQAARRRAEHALQESEERYRALAQQLAETARRKDEFLAMLSHELRNPLAAIRNGLEIFRLSDPSDPEAQETRQTVERQVQHLSRLVDDMIDVFGISHGKIALCLERLDFVALVRRVVRGYQEPAATAGLTLCANLPKQLVWVIADPKRLAQVIRHVLHNAVKFTPEGGYIGVSVDVDEKGEQAILRVRDTGRGLGRENLSSVFEDFVQIDPGYDRHRGGLGLGLALVKGLAELHGGQVEASSAGPGRGVVVTIRLPLAPQPRATTRTNADSRPERPLVRVLIVEDNRDAARTLQILLKKYGFAVEVAHTGRAGVEAAHNFQPQVVLCDLGLPEMDGFDVARTLRQDPCTVAARLIAISGFGQEEDRRRAYEAGFNLHLTKPVDPEELEQVLATQLSMLGR